MDGIAGLVVLLGLALLAMPVLLVVALVSLARLKRRVAALETALEGAGAHARVAASAPTAGRPPASYGAGDPVPAPAPASASASASASAEREPAQAPAAASPAASAPSPSRRGPPTLPPLPQAGAAPPRPVRQAPSLHVPAPLGALARVVRRWFSVGNVPVKIGVLVLLAGVAALLKYASDQGLFVLPMELRLAGVAASALAALAFAWRKRERNRAFALTLQGGAIGVLLLTVFAAFKLYAMLPAQAALALSVLLVAGAGLLAVLQDSRTLAVFALLAGFLAPIWLSTGSSNHVALFSYYAMLNAAVVGIAWFKSWRILNLLGFAFTFGIGLLWGASDYRADKYASSQAFLALFFAFYLAVPLLFARRRPEGRRDLVDGCLVFGTPLIAFAMQAVLMGSVQPDGSAGKAMAVCAVALGALYAALAWTLRRRSGYALLADAYAILAIGFATLAVPLALSARATAAVFALEGAGLVWLGLRQERRLPRWGGTVLQAMAAWGLLAGAASASGDVRPLFNPTAMGGALIAAAGLASAWAMRAHGRPGRALAFYLWGLAWWLGVGVHEIHRFVAAAARPDAWLALVALTGWLAAEAHRLRPARALALTLFAAFAAAAPLALWQCGAHAHPFGGAFGGAAWGLFAVLGLRGLWCLRGDGGGAADAAQFAGWILAPLVLSLWTGWLAGHAGLGQGWYLALVALPWLALAALALRRWPWLAAPRGEACAHLRVPLLWTTMAVIAMGWLLALKQPAASAPLAWIPLLNPAELAQALALALGAAWLWSPQPPAGLRALRSGALALGGFLLLSASVLRTVHHWGGVAWGPSMFSTSLAQTSLTVAWSVLGVVGWIVGSRRARRGLWLAGALLMGVVLAKLVLVDRQHLGNLLGIVSFIAYGVLCTLVGYLAPAPPRAMEEQRT